MNAAQENAIRSIAKQCHGELKRAKENNPTALHDMLNTEILDRYAKQLLRFCLPKFRPKYWLSWYVMQIDKEINERYL